MEYNIDNFGCKTVYGKKPAELGRTDFFAAVVLAKMPLLIKVYLIFLLIWYDFGSSYAFLAATF